MDVDQFMLVMGLDVVFKYSFTKSIKMQLSDFFFEISANPPTSIHQNTTTLTKSFLNGLIFFIDLQSITYFFQFNMTALPIHFVFTSLNIKLILFFFSLLLLCPDIYIDDDMKLRNKRYLKIILLHE